MTRRSDTNNWELVLQKAWRALGHDYTSDAITAAWIRDNTSPAQRSSMAMMWVQNALGDHERALVLRVERAAQDAREAEIDAYNNLPEVKAARATKRGSQIDESMERSRKHSEELKEMQAAYLKMIREEVDMEWTTALLGSVIRMPDGSLTTWGSATVEQHKARLKMFTANVVANAEGAARHQQAIEDIDAAGVSCLDELAREEVRA